MNHTKGNIGLWISILILFCACYAEEDGLLKTGHTDITFSVTIEAPSAHTRMQTGSMGHEAFQPADRISVLITGTDTPHEPATHHWLQYTAQGWQPPLSWRDFTGRQFRFTAFYPALSESLEPTFLHTVSTDQSQAADYGRSDLLTASTIVAHGQDVSLHFRHRMSLLQIKLSSEHTFTAEQLAQAEVYVRACPSVSIDRLQGSLSPVNGEEKKIRCRTEKNATFHAIVPPQTIREAWRTAWIDIVIDGQTLTYAAPRQLNDGSSLQQLESGHLLTLNLKLEKKTVEEDWANQTIWTYGLKDLPEPTTWGYAFRDVASDYLTYGLKWRAGYGWYDCNKTHPTAHSGGDSEMCWAAASANMLYWWLEQNKAYVERFHYTGPSEYKTSTDCAIFAHYKQHFPNEGGHVYEALDWFLTGRDVSFPMKAATQADPLNKGFFREILGEKAKVAQYTPLGDQTITQSLKKALRERKATECNIQFPSGYLHAINIWGADFDAQGEVTHLYITDNNDTDLDSQREYIDWKGRQVTQAGILRKAVQHRNGSTFIESSTPGNFSLRILQLCTLDLMQEKWEAYFASHPSSY